MKPPKRTTKNRKDTNLRENDDSDGDFSSGSGEEWAPDKEELGDSNIDIDSTLENSRNTLNGSEDDRNDIPFDTTSGFTLKIVKNYKMSKHPVWLMFGYLMKDDKIVKRVKDRFFCKRCFDKKKFKR